MSKRKKTLIAVIVLIALCAAAFCIWYLCGPSKDASSGEKEICVTVVHADGSRKQLTVSPADESQYGLFVTTVDGESADSAKQEWWCFSKNGEMLSTGVDDTPIADGESYEITLTVGYDG